MSAEFSAEWREDDASGTGVRYLVAGNGPPVVLLHGLSGSVAWWRRNLPALASSFRVYAIDLVHHGGRAEWRFALGKIAERLAAWMAATSLSHASIIGHSMGGYIATCLASEHPTLVDKLVLVNAATLFPNTGLRLAPTRLIRWLPTFPPSLAPILVRDALRAGAQTLWQSSRDLLTSDLRPRLGSVKAKTLIVWGERDGLVPVELAIELQSAIPGSELCVIPGAGHNPMWEASVAFNEVVLAFLRGDEASSSGAGDYKTAL